MNETELRAEADRLTAEHAALRLKIRALLLDGGDTCRVRAEAEAIDRTIVEIRADIAAMLEDRAVLRAVAIDTAAETIATAVIADIDAVSAALQPPSHPEQESN